MTEMATPTPNSNTVSLTVKTMNHRSSSGIQDFAPSSQCRVLWARFDIGNVLLILILALALIIVTMVLPTHHRFIFSLQDPSINFPLVAETVPNWLLGVLVAPVPFIMFLFIFYERGLLRQGKREIYTVIYGWAYSLILAILITSIIKQIAGRPRPNMVAMSGYQGPGLGYTASESDVANAYQSFPSGHASASFSSLGFVALYLFRIHFPSAFATREFAVRHHGNANWKGLLCATPLMLASFIAISRVVNYYHNFDDVLAGALLGIFIAAMSLDVHCSWLWVKRFPSGAVMSPNPSLKKQSVAAGEEVESTFLNHDQLHVDGDEREQHPTFPRPLVDDKV